MARATRCTFFTLLAKVLADPRGNHVLLTAIGGVSMSQPYPVRYEPDGSITLEMPRDPK